MTRSTRLLGLLQLLRGRRSPVTAGDLARGLGVSERTVYRDIAALVDQGAPIRGEAGLGYVLQPGLFLPPLMLESEEIEALLLGLAYVGQRGDEVLRRAAESTRAKVEAVLPSAMRPSLDELLAMTGPATLQAEGPVPLSRFRDAIRARAKLAIHYVDAGDRHSQRTIWPIGIGFMEGARVIAAWCELREDFRTFRADRIVSATENGRYTQRRAALLRRFHAALASP